ncbi:PREDICTED: GDSL esterase/lipase At4g10955 [Tarenaya hassleriana]|uniref:GDSL esterase/lipase At4g10955 n=1 Tax=Tarenaya hassleriana TaxID=28532 RepID=UPI00053C68B2|nr:PREDICTED: GDSL esterase/lipase At4g10955 [Tarenaya hassleriana]XP_010538834.1 PREDICTED: GDSL esterase/lipase At4g10955 [Tarenaya hassleriana]
MASEREDFSLSGPLHLTAIDWANEHHRRSLAACLVQGIYIAERDRQLRREGSEALAPPWSEFFNFRLIRHLVDDADFSIFGGIYEYRPPSSSSHSIKSLELRPRYVIAFRGTLTKPDSVSRDIELDIHIIRNGLHRTTRFEIAIQAVRSMVAAAVGNGSSGIWLAGHSLGAAMALLTGKTIAKTGIFLESFVFNPPFLSPPLERIKDKRIKHGIRIAGSVITAGLALAAKATQNHHHHGQQHRAALTGNDPFTALSEWLPRLYVNSNDHLSSEYVGYFEHRKKMEEIGAGAIEKLATQHSLGGLLMNAVTGGKNAAMAEEPIHLIPSAIVTVNSSPSRDFKEAHGIHRWWRDDQKIESKVYKYK